MSSVQTNNVNATANLYYSNQNANNSKPVQVSSVDGSAANNNFQDTVQFSAKAMQLLQSETDPNGTTPVMAAGNGYGLRPPVGNTPPTTGGNNGTEDKDN